VNKFVNLFLIISMVFCFSTCDFVLPTGVEINGTFENSIPVKMNVGAMLTDALDDALNGSESEDQKIYTCTQTVNKTYLVYVNLFDKNLATSGSIDPSILGGAPSGFPIPHNDPLIDIDTPVNLPLSDMGEYLINFKFKDPDILLYFSGDANIFEKIEIQYEVVDHLDYDISIYESPKLKINGKNPSGLSLNSSDGGKYTAIKPPSNGLLINKDNNNNDLFPLHGENVHILFKVYAIKDVLFFPSDFDGDFVVELVVWLPIEFEAVDDKAKIILPLGDIFPEDSDLFGRSQDDMSMTEMIKSLKLDMMFNSNPFINRDLVIWSGEDTEKRKIVINRKLTDNALTIDMNEDVMKDINNPDNWPFAPRFEILYKKGQDLGFPQNLTVVELAFRAGFKYGMNW